MSHRNLSLTTFLSLRTAYNKLCQEIDLEQNSEQIKTINFFFNELDKELHALVSEYDNIKKQLLSKNNKDSYERI